MKSFIVFLFGILALTSCAHKESLDFPKDRNPAQADEDNEIENLDKFNLALTQAGVDLTEIKGRRSYNKSQANAAKKITDHFTKLRNSLNYVVFPKKRNMADKSPKNDPYKYGAFIEFRSSTPRLLACNQLVVQPINDFSHKLFFPESSSPDFEDLASANCAILEFKYENSRPPEEGSVRKVRLYLDSMYRVWGMEAEIYSREESMDPDTESRLEPRWEKWALNKANSLSSGLLLFPIDLPHPYLMTKSNLSPLVLPDQRSSDQHNFNYVKDKLASREISLPCQQAYQMNFRDSVGGKTEIQWCPGDPWPSVINNDRFLAILRK